MNILCIFRETTRAIVLALTVGDNDTTLLGDINTATDKDIFSRTSMTATTFTKRVLSALILTFMSPYEARSTRPSMMRYTERVWHIQPLQTLHPNSATSSSRHNSAIIYFLVN